MKSTRRHYRVGFTLVELSIVMMVGLMIGAIVMALFNQHLTFLRIFRVQSFLSEEAPMVSLYVSRLVGNADRFRLHASVQDALLGKDPRLTESPVVLLNYRQPDGTIRASILSYEVRDGKAGLYYYVVPEVGLLGAPQWAVTTKPSNVVFFMTKGVLRSRLTGPAGEEIIYSGTIQ